MEIFTLHSAVSLLMPPVSCVVLGEQKKLLLEGRGIKPLLEACRTSGEVFQNAFVADKIIGKAAAGILASMGVQEVYAELLSQPAKLLLEKEGIPVQYRDLVPMIHNRENSGMCPMEQRVKELESPKEIYKVLESFLYPQG